MTSIPGIDDYDEEEVNLMSLHSSCKRPLSPDLNERQRKKTHLDDDEDRLLYGDESVLSPAELVNGKTLVTEKLPLKESEFMRRLLSDTHQDEQPFEELFSLVKQLQQIEATNVFQVTFITSLWLEARKRIQKPVADNEYRSFYPFMKYKSIDTLMLSCFCLVTNEKTEKSLVQFDKENRFTSGQLVSVRIMPVDNTVSPVTTYGYIMEHNRRLPENSLRLEVDVRRQSQCQAANTLIHEIELQIPFTDGLWRNSNFYLKLAPICLMSDIMAQVRAVYDIGANPLFRYFQSKDFSLAPTGIPITSKAHLFSPSQLEAIQRAFDLVTQPVPSTGNPCKAVFVDGKPEKVRQTIVEIMHQLSTNDITNKHQYIVVSSEESLRRLHEEIKQRPADFKMLKVFVAGHDQEKTVNKQAAKVFCTEMTSLQSSEQTDADNKKAAHFTKCLNLLQTNSPVSRVESDVLVTVAAFKQHALKCYLQKSRLILGPWAEFIRSPEMHQHLQSAKEYATASATSADSQNRFPISVCLIADADSLTDPELMALSKEFSFCRFILTSGWFEKHAAKSEFEVHLSLSDRVRLISDSADPPLLVDVGGDSV